MGLKLPFHTFLPRPEKQISRPSDPILRSLAEECTESISVVGDARRPAPNSTVGRSEGDSDHLLLAPEIMVIGGHGQGSLPCHDAWRRRNVRSHQVDAFAGTGARTVVQGVLTRGKRTQVEIVVESVGVAVEAAEARGWCIVQTQARCGNGAHARCVFVHRWTFCGMAAAVVMYSCEVVIGFTWGITGVNCSNVCFVHIGGSNGIIHGLVEL